MINAAIVGLGWWGKTLVESLAGGSDVMRFIGVHDAHGVARRRGVSPSSIRFVSPTATKRSSPIRRSTRWCSRRRRPGHVKQIMAAAAAGKHVFCEKPFTFSKKEAEAAVDAVRKAKVALSASATIGASIRRWSSLRERIRSRRARHHPAYRSEHDVSQRAVPAETVWRSKQGRGAGRRACADGRACDRRHDRSVRRRSTTCTARVSRARCRSTPTTRPRCCSA